MYEDLMNELTKLRDEASLAFENLRLLKENKDQYPGDDWQNEFDQSQRKMAEKVCNFVEIYVKSLLICNERSYDYKRCDEDE